MDTRYSAEQLELRSATAALLADLGPRTVADLDDDAPAGAARQGGDVGRGGSSCAGRARTTARSPPASRWRSWRGSWGGPRPTRRSSARSSPPTSPARPASSSTTPAPSVVLDAALLDFAVARTVGSAEGVAVDCAGVGARARSSARPTATRASDRRRRARRRRRPRPTSPARVAPVTRRRRRARRARSVTRSSPTTMRPRTPGAGAGDHGRRPRRHHGGRARHDVRVREGARSSTASPSVRSRRCSTCWPRRGCWSKGAISVAQYAAWAVDALPPEDALEAGAVAKAYCARAARTVCETAIQVHGGIGNTWECFVHVHLRRALLSSALFGDEGHHLRALARRRLGVRPWTLTTRPRKRRSASASAPGWRSTTRGCPRRRPTTSTGRGRRSGTARCSTPGSSRSTWPKRSTAVTSCRRCTR